jgi:hypothetical protein
VRAEDQHTVARIQERLAEELLKILRARPGHDVFPCDRQSVFAIHIVGRRRAEFHDAEGRAVAAVAIANRLHAGFNRPGRCGERTVAYFELDDVLAGSDKPLGDCKHGERRLDAHRRSELAE